MNSRDMERRCAEMTTVLWDKDKAEELLFLAADIVRHVVGDPFDRDHIRTEPINDALLDHFAKNSHD